MHHFYFFNGLFNVSVQLSCMWEDVRWLRQSMQVSMSSSSTLQARHKMLTAASQLQVRKITLQVRRCFEKKNCGQEVTSSPSFPPLPPSLPQSLLGTHNLGRVHYEPIKDRHGNVLLVTIRDLESQHSLFSGKWMQVAKLQSQRKSLSTPEEPYALDILIITIQVRKGRRGCGHRLSTSTHRILFRLVFAYVLSKSQFLLRIVFT